MKRLPRWYCNGLVVWLCTGLPLLLVLLLLGDDPRALLRPPPPDAAIGWLVMVAVTTFPLVALPVAILLRGRSATAAPGNPR